MLIIIGRVFHKPTYLIDRFWIDFFRNAGMETSAAAWAGEACYLPLRYIARQIAAPLVLFGRGDINLIGLTGGRDINRAVASDKL